ncbi:long-chain acyl-CoA synthetase [Roseiarcus fermentans]|uniref:Long-chain-fatty-acid--CoA ligase n=1 Tax=Roseiarcus fermentans TaxID=1473586 RepID=A0A366EJV9_9HYPH|nr:AMP-binding protein [Roseiarcus fermentans]RBP02707.1 long-chain acyl-CoA synthetase [Roseiarcus fermentans]
MERIWLKSYPEGVPADINPTAYPSLGDFFAASVERFRDRVAYVSLKRTMTYGELDLRSRAFASYLLEVVGLPRGARVALMMPNLLQYPVALFGALRAGYVVVNCNPLYSPRELHHQLADSGAEAVVALENFAQTLEKAIAGTSVRVVVVTGVGDLIGGARGFLANFFVRRIQRAVPPFRLPQAVRFNRALAEGRARKAELPRIEPTDLAFLQYTGGTTGVPKGAMLTHRNMIANLQQVAAWIGPVVGEQGETFVTALPLYHVFALTVNAFVPTMIGANNLLIPDPRDLKSFVKALGDTPFTVITGVNTLFNALLHNPQFLRLDFSRLHVAVGGGMALQRAVAERWKQVTGKPLIEGYGLTETAPIAAVNPLTVEDYSGAIGLPAPSTDIAIRDTEGRDVPLGLPGELCIKGPQVMAGYWMRPDETANVMTADGFLKTGDIARMDERGYLYIVDRKKDMILVSGFNVYPNEIEDVVMSHPGVREVGAVGVPDDRSGEAVKIVVVRKHEGVTDADIIAHCRQHLTGYKTPRHVEFRDTLPRSPIGKILRRELKDPSEPKKQRQKQAADEKSD